MTSSMMEGTGPAPLSRSPKKSSSRRPRRHLHVFGTLAAALAAIVLGGLLLLELLKPEFEVDFKKKVIGNTEFIHALANLELAERGANETVQQTESASWDFPFWKIQSQAIYEVRFSATYTYVVDVNGPWDFRLKDGDVLLVKAPPLLARPPAIDTSTIQGQYNGGWLIFGEDIKLEELKSSLSSIAAERAQRAESLDMVREHARRQLQDFLKGWAGLAGYEVEHVVVRFADELKNPRIEPPKISG